MGAGPRTCLAAGLTLATALAIACGPIREPPGSPAPVNACPAQPCSGFSQSSCIDGACTTPAPSTGIILVVSLSQDSLYAPGQQFVVPFEHLGDVPTATCTWPACGHLPGYGTDSGGYQMSAFDQSAPGETNVGGVGFFLGNARTLDAVTQILPAWLPSHATYRLLADKWHDDVAALGLPVAPVQAVQLINNATNVSGPYGASPLKFSADLPPGTYERVVTPDPSYDEVFSPQVRQDVTVNDSNMAGPLALFDTVTPGEQAGIDTFDRTQELVSGCTLPTFTIQGSDNPLDGWTGFLRDATTKVVLSNVRPLDGMIASSVQLVTNHSTPASNRCGETDALLNAELVVAPPPNEAIPTAVFVLLEQTIKYPHLAPSTNDGQTGGTTVTGSVIGPNGPVSADLIFESLAFTDDAGKLNYPNFEFLGRTSARPTDSDATTRYALNLPAGAYRVEVVPIDGSAGLFVGRVDVPATGADVPFKLVAQATIAGTARLSDGRVLADAEVDALPLQCTFSADLEAAATDALLPLLNATAPTPWCLPRPAQTTADSHGRFTLALDSGKYTLRVRPRDGTSLPWTLQALDVGTANQQVEVVTPAPFHLGFQLFGADETPLADATVQAFAIPSLQGPTTAARLAGKAAEIGETLTDASGRCDLYMTLPP